MGYKGQVQRQRNSQFDRERRARDHRRETAKKQRRGGEDETESRKIQIINNKDKRPDPTAEQRKLLVSQMAMAARIPGAAHDLILVLEGTCPTEDGAAAGNSTAGKFTRGKRSAPEDDDHGAAHPRTSTSDKPATVVISPTAASTLKAAVKAFTVHLPDLIVDELGSRCIVTLLSNLSKYHANTEAAAGVATAASFIDAIFALEDEEAFKAKYQSGEEVGHGIELEEVDADALEPVVRPKLDLLSLASHHNARSVVWAMISNGNKEQQKKIAEAIVPISQNLATHRHGSIALLRLLEAGEKNAKILAAKLLPTVPMLLGDAVGFNVASALINNSNRQQIFKSLGAPQGAVMKLIGDKRGSRFLIKLLTLSEGSSEATADATKMVTEIAEQVCSVLIEKFIEMATDRQGNFLLQALIKASASSPQLQKKIYGTLSNDLVYLARHNIGVHVVLCLANHGDKKAVRGPLNVALNQSLVNLVSDQYGSLVVRALLEKVDHTTYQALEPHIDSLMGDPSGNLVVQQLIKGLSQQQLQTFVTKHVKKNLVALCQHKFAAHVIFKLFDVVDANTHNELCTLLKPHVLSLAVHVSGRFVVEKLVTIVKDARATILTNFTKLAESQGTQNLLTQTYVAADANAKKTLVTSTIVPNIAQLATQKTSSIVLQKMVQAEAGGEVANKVLVPALKAHFKAEQGLAQSLSRDFHGRFVIERVNSVV